MCIVLLIYESIVTYITRKTSKHARIVKAGDRWYPSRIRRRRRKILFHTYTRNTYMKCAEYCSVCAYTGVTSCDRTTFTRFGDPVELGMAMGVVEFPPTVSQVKCDFASIDV